jgi:dihydroorotate dehydrogenase
MYEHLRPLLFTLDAEAAHHLATHFLSAVEALPPARAAWARRFHVADPRLKVNLFGLEFPNPVGLAAGFDKDGEFPRALAALGFGAVEVGTVTALPQPGNPAPRMFRLPADRGLINRMGFNNHGAAALAERLRGKKLPVPLGINLGKSKVTPNEDALADYLTSLEHLYALADYVVVNVSSPNTPGLRALQDREPLQKLLAGVQRRLAERTQPKKPLLLKIAPDLSDAQLDDIVALLAATPVEGIIATNTTIGRGGLATPAAEVAAMGAGGLSGAPVRARSTEVIRRLYTATRGKLPIVGVGGIFTAEDAIEKLKAGASLVQVYTGFIYGGPMTVRRINEGLVAYLDKHGVTSVADLVGTEAKPG